MTLASDFEVEHYLDHQAEIFLARFDPLTYLYLSRVMDYFDPFAERSPSAAVHAATCSSPSTATGASAPSTRATSCASCARWAPTPRHVEVALAVGARLVPDGRARVPGARRGVPGVGSPHARSGGLDAATRSRSSTRRGCRPRRSCFGSRRPSRWSTRSGAWRCGARRRSGSAARSASCWPRRPAAGGGRRDDPRRAADRGQPRVGRRPRARRRRPRGRGAGDLRRGPRSVPRDRRARPRGAPRRGGC